MNILGVVADVEIMTTTGYRKLICSEVELNQHCGYVYRRENWCDEVPKEFSLCGKLVVDAMTGHQSILQRTHIVVTEIETGKQIQILDCLLQSTRFCVNEEFAIYGIADAGYYFEGKDDEILALASPGILRAVAEDMEWIASQAASRTPGILRDQKERR